MMDDDEQLARAIQESMIVRNGTTYDFGNAYGNGHMHGGGNVYDSGDIYYPRPIAFSMDFRFHLDGLLILVDLLQFLLAFYQQLVTAGIGFVLAAIWRLAMEDI